MSIAIMTEVWRDAPVSGTELLILLALADWSDDERRTSFPGIPSLARKARVSERTAKRAIQSLRAAGLVKVTRNAGPSKTNLYTIAAMPQADGPDCHPPADQPDGPNWPPRWATGGLSDGPPVSPYTLEDTSEDTSVPPLTPQGGAGGCAAGEVEKREKQVVPISQHVAPGEVDADDQSISPEVKFEDAWRAYPRKVGKGAARQAWEKAKKKEDVTVIAQAVQRFADVQRAQDDQSKIPHFSTWLNQERWQDDQSASLNAPRPARTGDVLRGMFSPAGRGDDTIPAPPAIGWGGWADD